MAAAGEQSQSQPASTSTSTSVLSIQSLVHPRDRDVHDHQSMPSSPASAAGRRPPPAAAEARAHEEPSSSQASQESRFLNFEDDDEEQQQGESSLHPRPPAPPPVVALLPSASRTQPGSPARSHVTLDSDSDSDSGSDDLSELSDDEDQGDDEVDDDTPLALQIPTMAGAQLHTAPAAAAAAAAAEGRGKPALAASAFYSNTPSEGQVSIAAHGAVVAAPPPAATTTPTAPTDGEEYDDGALDDQPFAGPAVHRRPRVLQVESDNERDGDGEDEDEGGERQVDDNDDEEEEEEEEEGDDDDDGQGEEEEEVEEEEIDDDPFALEVAGLYEAVPILRSTYRIHEKLGEGTFSTVYKAQAVLPSSRHYAHGSNSNTNPYQNRGSSAQAMLMGRGNAFVALKRIYVSSSPSRILNELDILEELKGHEHISSLINIFRERDQVIAVMSYSEHADFRDYYRILPMSDIRCYFRCLFSALAAVHAAQVIHRDVKPANFLYNPLTGHGTLCDFGLAERFDPDDWKGKCHHTCPDEKHRHGEAKVNRKVPSSVLGAVEASAGGGSGGGGGGGGTTVAGGGAGGRATGSVDVDEPYESAQSGRTERVGYLRDDTRQPVRANRAGTRGFRAPEVLFKCQDQTVALDIWSAGVILLCMLTKRFPLFNADDDVVALLELGVLFGRKKMEVCAMFHNRTFKTDIPDISEDGFKMQDFVRRLHPEPFAEINTLTAALGGDASAAAAAAEAASTSTPSSSAGPRRPPLGELGANARHHHHGHVGGGGSGGGEPESDGGPAAPPMPASASTAHVAERARRLAQLRADWLGAMDLVRLCLQPIHTKRWTAERIVREHRFFNPAVSAVAAPVAAAASGAVAGSSAAGGSESGAAKGAAAAIASRHGENDERKLGLYHSAAHRGPSGLKRPATVSGLGERKGEVGGGGGEPAVKKAKRQLLP